MGQKITRVRAYQAELALREGAYIWSGGRSVTAFDTTIVGVETDAGLVGWGEVTPLGATYLPAYPAGARRGIETLAPHLIGADPTRLDQVNRLMDAAMLGHPYVKSALDMACWDILGKTAGLPVLDPLGRPLRRGHRPLPLLAARHARGDGAADGRVPGGGVQAVPAQGRQHGGGGYRPHPRRRGRARARRRPGRRTPTGAGSSTRRCASCALCATSMSISSSPARAMRNAWWCGRATDHPMVLDECIDSLAMLLRAQRDGAMDALNIKLSKYGGLTRPTNSRPVRGASASR